jgi:hypothetical protein
LPHVRLLERATRCFRFCRWGRQGHQHVAALWPGRQQIMFARRSLRRFVRGEARIGTAIGLLKEYQDQYQRSGHPAVSANVDRERCPPVIDALLSRIPSHQRLNRLRDASFPRSSILLTKNLAAPLRSQSLNLSRRGRCALQPNIPTLMTIGTRTLRQ